MATWHQKQNPVCLWHETQWTVVEDDGHTAVSRFDDARLANLHLNKLKHNGHERVYVIPPRQHQMRKS